MARKNIKTGKSPRRKLSTFADDFPLPKTSEGSSRVPAKPASVKTGEPSGGPLAKRGSTDVARPGRPSIDVDGRQKRLPGYKTVPVGPEERVKRPAIQAPEKPAIASEAAKGLGRKAAIIAGASLIPDISREAPNADKPRNYPGEGLSPVGPPRPSKASETATVPASKPTSKPAPKLASKPTEAKPVRAAAPSVTPVKAVKASKPVTKVSTPTATKAKSGSSSSDGYMDDLRASARRMRDASSEMAEKTGTMKEKLGALSRSFKKGGSIKSRGDGIAQRGKTKGRFV